MGVYKCSWKVGNLHQEEKKKKKNPPQPQLYILQGIEWRFCIVLFLRLVSCGSVGLCTKRVQLLPGGQ